MLYSSNMSNKNNSDNLIFKMFQYVAHNALPETTGKVN